MSFRHVKRHVIVMIVQIVTPEKNIALNREHGAHAHTHTTRLGMSTSPTAVGRSGGFAHCTVPHTRERAMAAAQATTRNVRENDMIVGVLATTCSARENTPRLGCWLPMWTMQRANKTRERESGSRSGRKTGRKKCTCGEVEMLKPATVWVVATRPHKHTLHVRVLQQPRKALLERPSFPHHLR
jgi:hypothetical protein